MKKETSNSLKEIIGTLLAKRDEVVQLLNQAVGALSKALDETGTVSYPGTKDELMEDDVPVVSFREGKGPYEGRLCEGIIRSINVYKSGRPVTISVVVMDFADGKEAKVEFDDIERLSIPALLEFIDRFAATGTESSDTAA